MNPTHAEFLEANKRYQTTFVPGGDGPRPSRHVAILTCMDARIDVFQMLGLKLGESHIVRNAGGIATNDSVRSLCLSQWALGTTEIAVVQHTNCGLENLDEDAMRQRWADHAGSVPPWPIGSFEKVEDSVRESVARLRSDPYLLHTTAVRGYVYNVDNGELTTVV